MSLIFRIIGTVIILFLVAFMAAAGHIIWYLWQAVDLIASWVYYGKRPPHRKFIFREAVQYVLDNAARASIEGKSVELPVEQVEAWLGGPFDVEKFLSELDNRTDPHILVHLSDDRKIIHIVPNFADSVSPLTIPQSSLRH